VGLFAIRRAVRLGARMVIALDRVPERLDMAEAGGAIAVNFDEESVLDRIAELTRGRGPEKCIDAVGMEAHVTRSIDSMLDRAKQAVKLETDRPHVLREMIYVCRPGGILSVAGVYAGLVDKLPMGALMNKALTIKTGQTHVAKYHTQLLKKVEAGEIDPSFVITHTVDLDEGPAMYQTFRDKHDGCIKVVLKP
jgi:threonine dehydrogenase-like Zn-dependent dehydrogenase